VSPTTNMTAYIIYAALFFVAVGAFVTRVTQIFSLINMGVADPVKDHGSRIKDFFVYVLAEMKVLQRPVAGLAHLLVFYGFLVISIQSGMMWLQGFFPGLEIGIIEFNPVYVLLLDTFDSLVLLMVAYFFVRRLVFRPRALSLNGEALLILILIAFSAASDLTANAFRYAGAAPAGSGYLSVAPWAFVSNNIAAFLRGSDPAYLRAGFAFAWWWHTLTVLSFLVFITYSKHLHLVTAMFSTYLRNKRPKGELPKIENIEEQENFGVHEIDQFTRRDLVSLAACTECGRCQEACPAYATGKPLNPKAVVLDLKDYMLHEGPKVLALKQANASSNGAQASNGHAASPTLPAAAQAAHSLDLKMVGDVITEDVIWACTTCQACVTACPVFIEPMARLIDMRRYLVLEESSFPTEVTRTFQNMERNGNIYPQSNSGRGDWAKELGVPLLAEQPDAEILFFVGCFGSFDQRNRKTVQAFATILQAAGVKFAILGKEEKCTGDPARRMGNEYLYQTLATENVETMNGYNVKKVVTACPHCFNTIKNEYPQFSGNYEVLHHTQLIDTLIKEGRIKLTGSVDEDVTYHDPCYIGRYNDIYDAPRDVLAAIPGIRLTEMPRTKKNSFCCGGGGGRVFMDEHTGTKVNQTRSKEAAATGATTLAASCPYCMTMFEDGIKGADVAEQIKPLDIAELVARSMEPPRAGEYDLIPMRRPSPRRSE